MTPEQRRGWRAYDLFWRQEYGRNRMDRKQIWHYQFRHLPSGDEGRKQTDFVWTRLEFLEKLNEWNRHAPGAPIHYVYWEGL